MSDSEEFYDDLTQDDEFEFDYLYAMIRFKHEGRKKKIEDIDLVPTDWLSFKKKVGLQCPFLESMEEEEDIQLLHDLVKTNGPVPPGWTLYSVEVVGRAQSYEEGMTKLEALETTSNVFTDSEKDDKAEKALIRQVKRKQLLAVAESLKKKMKTSHDVIEPEALPESKNAGKKDVEESIPLTNSKKQTSRRIEAGNGSSSEDDPSIPSSSGCFEQLNTLNAITRSPSTDESQLSPASSGTQISSDKENVPRESTESLLNVTELPVMDISSVSCENSFETAVIVHLTGLHEKIDAVSKDNQEIAKRQRVLLHEFNKLANKSDIVDLQEKYGFSLPFKKLEDFSKFDEELTTNASLRKDLYGTFKSCLDPECAISRTMGLILRKFVTKEVLLLYTAVKGSSLPNDKDKNAFEPLQFCKCIYSFIRIQRTKKNPKDACSDGDLRAGLSSTFSNARKWK